jgi:tRNA (cmo5U34)-methyltransferase
VVSSLSIHHLDNLQKMILFHRVYQMLRPGGLFILGDLALAEDEQTEQETQRLWSEFINKSPLDAVAKCNAHERIALDMPAKISELTAFFQYSGFANVQLSFQYRNFTVFTCLKSNL